MLRTPTLLALALAVAGASARAQVYPPTIQLPDHGGEQVSVIEGIVEGHRTARLITSVGDVNADGIEDFLLASGGENGTGEQVGAAFVLFGSNDLEQLALLDLSTLDGTDGFMVLGLAEGDGLGEGAGGAGDLNSDGIDDLAIGAPGVETLAPGQGGGEGVVYVLFGAPGIGAGGVFDLAALDGSNGFVIRGEHTGGSLGRVVDHAGDVNADGHDDLLVGASFAGTEPVVYDVTPDWGRSVSGGDFDGDQDMDLVVLSEAAQTYTLLFNDGAGHLTPVQHPLPGYPSTIAAVDLDQDGLGDLVATTRGSTGQVSVMRALGGGSFSLPVVLALGADRTALAIGDVNADTFADVVATSYQSTGAGSGEVYIFLNDQSGGFLAPQVKNTLGDPRLVQLGDFDTDGDVDIVVHEAGVPQLGFYGNDGLGTFTKVKKISTPVFSDMAVGDVDGDGHVDIAATLYSTVAWYHNKGNGDFKFFESSTNPFSGPNAKVELRDLDGDTDLDVLLGVQEAGLSTLTTLENFGGGAYSAPRAFPIDAFGISDLFIGELTGDQDLDVFAGIFQSNFGPYGDVTLVTGNGDLSFHGVQRGRAYVVFGGPGVGASGGFDVADLDGANGFVMEGWSGGDRLGEEVAGLGDVDADGLEDFAVSAPYSHRGGSSTGSVYVVFGASQIGSSGVVELSSLSPSTGLELVGPTEGSLLGRGWSSLGQVLAGRGDFDGDGVGDFALAGAYPLIGGIKPAGIAYLIRGRSDLGATGVDLGTLDGTQGFAVQGAQDGDLLGDALHLGSDFNDDGRADLVLGAPWQDGTYSSEGRALVVLGRDGNLYSGLLDPDLLDGANGFAVLGEEQAAYLGASVGGGDFDGDGIDDLLLGESGVDVSPVQTGRGFVFWGRNPSAPTSYCTAGTTGSGCQALMDATGVASLAATNGFDLVAGGVEGAKQGLFFWGTSTKAVPWGGSTSWLCVAAPTKRTGAQSSGGTSGQCDGRLQLDFNTWMTANPTKAPVAGTTVYAQAWFRDPPSPKSTSLSDAIGFVVLP